MASEDARWLYTSGKDGWIIKWDLYTGRKVHTFLKVRPSAEKVKANGKGKAKAKAAVVEDVDGHTDEIWTLAISPDGHYLASGGKDRKVGVWDVEKNEWLRAFKNHRNSISVRHAQSAADNQCILTPYQALAFRKTGKSLASASTPLQLYSGGFDHNIHIFDLSVMGYVETMFGHTTPVLGLDALMRETAVSAGGMDKTTRFWKVQDSTHLILRGGERTTWYDALDGEELGDGADMDVNADAKKKKAKPGEPILLWS